MLLFCTFAALAREMLRGSLSSPVYDDAMEDAIENVDDAMEDVIEKADDAMEDAIEKALIWVLLPVGGCGLLGVLGGTVC